jgi:hypothetical protein
MLQPGKEFFLLQRAQVSNGVTVKEAKSQIDV